MIHCTTCQIDKPEECFAKKRTGFQTECKECHKIYIREHYKQNKEYYIAKAAEGKRNLRNKIAAYKEANPCEDCQKFFPACCMDFDHIDPKLKISSVSFMAKAGNSKAILEEMAKCRLLCACCHRIRTHKNALVSPLSSKQMKG